MLAPIPNTRVGQQSTRMCWDYLDFISHLPLDLERKCTQRKINTVFLLYILGVNGILSLPNQELLSRNLLASTCDDTLRSLFKASDVY